ncbi:MAG: polysaccharide biosynthesis tyrosine autokinase [Bacteroidota bacterium]
MKTAPNRRAGGNASSERTLQDYLAIIVRGKWVVLSVFSAVIVLTILVTKIMDPVYKSSCQVLLNTRELQSSLFLDAVRPEYGQNITQNELAILNSRSLADSVAGRIISQRPLDESGGSFIPVILPPEDLPGSASLAPLALVSGRISDVIDFEPVRESDVITVTAKSKSAIESALIANTYAEAYRDRNIYMSRSKSRAFKEFLEDQASEKQRELVETEAALQTYMERHGIVSLDEEARKVIDQLAALEATRDATDISLRQMRNTLASYQEQLPQQETNVARLIGEGSDPYIRLLQEQLAKLEVQRDVIVAQNPSLVGREMVNEKVREIDSQINALRLKLQKETDKFLRTLTPTEGGGPGDAAGYLKSIKQKIIETGIQVQALEAKKLALNDAIRQQEVKFERIPRKSVELARLQRSRLSNEKLYLMVEEKFNEANITEKSNIGYVEIIERAAVPFAPASPKMFINLAIGIILGLGLGLVVVLTKEFLDVRIHSPEDIKRRDLVPLGTVVSMDGELLRLSGQQPSGNGNRKLDSRLVTVAYPFSSVAESYRQIRTNLQFARPGQMVRSILVTSSIPGEGKSTSVSNLAIAFAQAGKKTLLVDADLRMPNLNVEFRVKKEPGLADYLNGKAALDEVAQKTKIDNLSVATCGKLPSNPAEILVSDRMRDFIEKAKQQFDFLLFDSPPLLAATDASILSTLVEGTLVVVSAGRTRAEELDQGVELLERVGGKVMGVLINNFDPHRAYGIGYRRGRQRYYGYGRHYEQTASAEAGQKKSPQRQA